MEPTHDLDKLTIDILQRLIVRLECVHKLRLRVHDFLRQHDGADPFKPVAPVCNIGTVVRCAEEQDSIGRHEDGPKVLCLRPSDLRAVDQGPFDHQASQAMCDPYNRTFGGPTNSSVALQHLDQLLGVVMYLVLGSAIGEAGDIGVVAIYQHTRLLILQNGR